MAEWTYDLGAPDAQWKRRLDWQAYEAGLLAFPPGDPLPPPSPPRGRVWLDRQPLVFVDDPLQRLVFVPLRP